MLAYRAEIYLWVLAHVLPFILMSVWVNASEKAPGSFSMSPAKYAQYFAAVFIVRQFSAIWLIYEFEWHALEGRLSPMLLRPMNVLWHYIGGHLAEQLARFPFFLFMLILFLVVYPTARWVPTPSGVMLGIFAIYCAFALRFAMQYCFTMLTFWFERASAIDQLTMLPYLFLSGMAIPLADMPANIRTVLYFTPFPYMIDFPARLLTNQLSWRDPFYFQGLGIAAAWFAGMTALGAVLWKRGLLQYSGQGA
jgi:ABC-2 type transport system permease protein